MFSNIGSYRLNDATLVVVNVVTIENNNKIPNYRVVMLRLQRSIGLNEAVISEVTGKLNPVSHIFSFQNYILSAVEVSDVNFGIGGTDEPVQGNFEGAAIVVAA